MSRDNDKNLLYLVKAFITLAAYADRDADGVLMIPEDERVGVEAAIEP